MRVSPPLAPHLSTPGWIPRVMNIHDEGSLGRKG
jgi:hypothetical protein